MVPCSLLKISPFSPLMISWSCIVGYVEEVQIIMSLVASGTALDVVDGGAG